MTARIKILDFESTDITDDAQVCEIGVTDLLGYGTSWDLLPTRSSLVNPGVPIRPGASAVHHLTDADVAGAPAFASVAHDLLAWPDDSPPILAAHYAKHDRGLWDPPGARWICTWKVALRLAPQAPAWSLQTLRYWLKLDLDHAAASPAHRAGPDSLVCAALLRRMLVSGKMTVDEMVAVSGEPALLPRITFGQKHRGQNWDEPPLSYLEWIIEKSEFDENAKFTARHWLDQRRR